MTLKANKITKDYAVDGDDRSGEDDGDGDDVSGKDNLVGQFPKCDDSTGGEWSNQHQWCSSPELCQILQQLYKGKHYFHRKSHQELKITQINIGIERNIVNLRINLSLT